MDQLYCKTCGKPIMRNVKFCASCGTPVESNFASDSFKDIKMQSSPPKGERPVKKISTSESIAYTVASIVCIVLAVFLCIAVDPWGGMSIARLGAVITLGFLAVVLQLISIRKAIIRM